MKLMEAVSFPPLWFYMVFIWRLFAVKIVDETSPEEFCVVFSLSKFIDLLCVLPKGEEHYNCISALHKSMRGSNENASLYWLGRMLEGGEDPLYVARRLVRFASEDVGK